MVTNAAMEDREDAGRVAGKRALVTGGASGLGRETARLLVAEGARVAIADMDAARGREAAAELGEAACFIPLDVTDEAAWIAAVAEAEAAMDGLDVLVNSAGINLTKSVVDLSLDEWRRVHDIDLDGVFLGCKHAIPAMARTVARDGGGASIVNISSVAGIVAGHNLAAYNSAKAAVRGFSKSVALHCARQNYGIRCNSLHPAFVDTPILDEYRDRFGEDTLAKLGRQIPLGRVGRPIEVAYAILYLASDESSFTTGTELVIDGGLTAM